MKCRGWGPIGRPIERNRVDYCRIQTSLVLARVPEVQHELTSIFSAVAWRCGFQHSLLSTIIPRYTIRGWRSTVSPSTARWNSCGCLVSVRGKGRLLSSEQLPLRQLPVYSETLARCWTIDLLQNACSDFPSIRRRGFHSLSIFELEHNVTNRPDDPEEFYFRLLAPSEFVRTLTADDFPVLSEKSRVSWTFEPSYFLYRRDAFEESIEIIAFLKSYFARAGCDENECETTWKSTRWIVCRRGTSRSVWSAFG